MGGGLAAVGDSSAANRPLSANDMRLNTNGTTVSQRRRKQEFVLEANGKPLVAMLVSSSRFARDLCRQNWFTSELSSYRSGGVSLLDGKTELSVRRATASESAELQVALARELSDYEHDDLVFCFLVPLDPVAH
jgi:hypothetical protein